MIIVSKVFPNTYTSSIKTCFPTTGIKENTLSNKHPAGQAMSIGFDKWCLVEEKNGHIPMPKSGMLNIHLYVKDRP